jgi:cyclopropane-fatty-acyl-phospholipid synthase
MKQLARLKTGRLTVTEGRQRHSFGDRGTTSDLHADIEILAPSVYRNIAFGGTIGAGEAYMQGTWRSDDLVSLFRLFLQNRRVLDDMEKGTARLTRPMQKLFHRLNRNTRSGARRNIAAHYDLGNEFFELWLDESMMYSSAIFAHESMTLAQAQYHRLEVICDKLDLGPGDHLVEIGTGWGGLAMHAAKQRGCRVTTTTISKQQFEMARRRFREAGLDDRIKLLCKDYRDLSGRYDKLVSVEMIEAIGSDQYDIYFDKCSKLLRPGGRMLIQAITIAEEQYPYAQTEVDFIQRYIFPGGCLPSFSAMANAIGRVSNLLITGVEDIGRHYALTLHHWRRNFFDRIDTIRALGYPEEFIRMWEFYLTYCEGGFAERAITNLHVIAEKPT